MNRGLHQIAVAIRRSSRASMSTPRKRSNRGRRWLKLVHRDFNRRVRHQNLKFAWRLFWQSVIVLSALPLGALLFHTCTSLVQYMMGVWLWMNLKTGEEWKKSLPGWKDILRTSASLIFVGLLAVLGWILAATPVFMVGWLWSRGGIAGFFAFVVIALGFWTFL